MLLYYDGDSKKKFAFVCRYDCCCDVQKLALTPTPENHDSIDGGWFQAKKVGESNDWSGLSVKVEPNTTGRNRYAEVNLYHEKACSSAVVKIYQDCK